MNHPLCPSSSVALETDIDWRRASDEALDKLCTRLQRWLPFATIERGIGWSDGSADDRAVHVFVGVHTVELEVTAEILRGFFSFVSSSSANAPNVTFFDEGSAPPIRVHVILSGSVLDDFSRFENARRNCGGLLEGKEQFAIDGTGYRRASTDGQRADTDTSFRQAVASV